MNLGERQRKPGRTLIVATLLVAVGGAALGNTTAAPARAGNTIAGTTPTPPLFDGVDVDICLLNPNSSAYVKNSKGQDLIEIAAHLGINFFRVNDGGCAGGPAANTASASDWALVLNKMAQYGIQAQVVSGLGGGFGSTSISPAVSKVINNQLGSYPNVYGYDLVNEPILNSTSIAALLQARQQIKAVYPNLALTVGGWKVAGGTYGCPSNIGFCWQVPQNGQLLSSVVDYYSPHIYGFDRPLNGPYPDPYYLVTNYLDQMLPYTAGEPILIGEYGASNGDAVTDISTLASQALQANATDGVLRAVRAYHNRNVVGSAQWAFYDRSWTTGTPGWDLLYNHGDTILPAAYVIQKDRTGTSDIPLNLPMPIPGADYIFQNSDSGKTVSVNQNDTVGIDLNLTSASYSLDISDPSLFSVTESLEPGNGTYKSVLHPLTTGTATVSVTANNCTSGCQVFQITLAVNPSTGPIPPPSVTSQANILQNSSFEGTSLSPWTFSVTNATATLTQDSTTDTDNGSSAKVAITTSSSSSKIRLTQAKVNVTADTIFPIYFWAKGSIASSITPQVITVGFQEYGGTWTTYCSPDVYITSTSWQQYSVNCTTYSVTPGYTTNFYVDFGADTGDMWVDNVIVGNAATVPPVPSPTSTPTVPAATPTSTPTAPAATPTSTPSPLSTVTPTLVPPSTPAPTPASTAAPSPTPTRKGKKTPTPTPSPTNTPPPLSTAAPTLVPTSAPAPTPTSTPAPTPTSTSTDPTCTSTAIPTPTGAVHHYFYAFPNGSMYVYDADNGWNLIKQVSLPTLAGVRGVEDSPATGMLYISYGGDGGVFGNGSLLAYNLLTNSIVYNVSYPFGIDSFGITPNGKTIYMPDGELSTDGVWHVIAAATGKVTGQINAGSGAHNTLMDLSGCHVYLTGIKYNYVDEVGTSTNTIVKQIGPLISGGRPLTVNGKETLLFTAATKYLGFQVSDVTTGKVVYTVPVNGFTTNGLYNAPSHGISLSPDEKEIYLMDGDNGYVHVFDVSGLPSVAPKQVADIKLDHPTTGNESPCAYDCGRDGWVLHSRDGRYVYVGDSGDVISTATRQIVKYLDPLYNSRKYLEIDWQNGIPVDTTTRYGSGHVTN